MNRYIKRHRGFTLIEMIVVIVITGVIGGMVAMFIRAPVQGYVDSARRAEMSDIADTAMRRIARDLHTAVPNSVRILAAGGAVYLEFLPTRDGGRYRVNPANGAGGCAAVAGNTFGDALNFALADTCFEIVGTPITFVTGDRIVVGSTQSSGNPPYCVLNSCVVGGVAEGGVLRLYTGAVGAQSAVVMAGAAKLPDLAEVDGHRFEIVPFDQQAVTYVCTGMGIDGNGDGTGTLTRFWGYGFNPTQIPPPIGLPGALLASNLSGCAFVYAIANQRSSLVAVTLTVTRGRNGIPESVNLYHEIHVNNIP
jgi:MSHA biogenesis protein MshO